MKMQLRTVYFSAMFCVFALCFVPFMFAAIAPHALAADTSAVVQIGLIAQLLGVVPSWLQAASLVVTAASAIAALTPTPKDDNVISKARNIIDILAFNWGGAANKSNDQK